MARKEKNARNHQAHEAWLRRKRENSATLPFQNAQRMWRRACLRQRAAEGRLTAKNRAEMERLGN
jgi:hypothetical protein